MVSGLAMFSGWEIVGLLAVVLVVFAARAALDWVQILENWRYEAMPGWLVAFSLFLLVFTGLIAANGVRF
jgi:hypothetical protein